MSKYFNPPNIIAVGIAGTLILTGVSFVVDDYMEGRENVARIELEKAYVKAGLEVPRHLYPENCDNVSRLSLSFGKDKKEGGLENTLSK